ncbi:dihydrolipoyllysine-residue acetyltransferase [Candidatus Contendibacter odensensis]|uniref:Acetyltransferase component of pyruvate dehydrogenase complex n=1 Tax=Candidatus Contendobacter odensis Run_B_J11 TaxID=1400861 RepID=A0A7U7GA05_9GAMM|nr:dihydrolipoyllysine-residue acetyltransferase [Candidatus Contendobacter odensis]MBK8755000.1 dihydrolipoyllysine-residue acetyltransferase [Candidatus Competibacteraceae bacterium]CDH44605.1 pyruvate dehydrogenase, dihydrolipoyltransacetylase component E2 [Candidatus Contendobacter odensis Run_B_J11]
MSIIKEIHVPDIGDFKGVDIIEVMVAAGDVIEVETPLIILETDKASMEVPSPLAGLVREVKVKPGDKISQGDPILFLEIQESVTRAEPTSAASDEAAAAASLLVASETREVRIPDIGDFKNIPVIEVLVTPGDRVEIDTPLATLESDKASMDIPSPFAGTVQAVEIKVGDKVSQGDLILLLVTTGDSTAKPQLPDTLSAIALGPRTPKPQHAPPAPPVKAPPVSAVPAASFARVHASPSIRRFARELGVDLTRVVKGSGPKGRILKDDVQSFVKQVMSGTFKPASLGEGATGGLPAGYMGIPPIPPVDFSKYGPIETQPLSRINKLSGANLHRAWLNIPHVTHQDEADITEVEAFRVALTEEAKARDLRVTMLGFLLKASAAALKQFPAFNASLDASGENLILKQYIHIGVAVDTPDGLVVPVIRDVDKKSIFDLSAELGALSAKARNKKLGPGEMQGGCFTISSLGGIGGIAFTPIINAPEVAILGVTRSKMAPVWNGKDFTPRLLLPLSVSYDHRVIDGAQAARFTAYLARLLGDIRRLLL